MDQLTVAVLGGSGFLGQHVVSELLTEAQKMGEGEGQETKATRPLCIKEIWVLDVKPYTPCVVSPSDTRVKVVFKECDVRELSQLKEALAGAAAVINCAAVLPNFTREDLGCNSYMRQVNVDGVKNVVEACCEAGVGVLVHTSTIVVVKTAGNRLLEHTETLTPRGPEKDLLLGDYALMRLRAEHIVLGAHLTPLSTGAKLQTVVLRPPITYGEGDTSFVPLVLGMARAGGNRLPSVGNPEAFLQAAYVGNVAVAHVNALGHLISGRSDGMEGCGGMPVYVTDDTPPHNLSGLAEPFLHHLSLQPSKNHSYWIISLMMLIASIWAMFWSLLGFKKERNLSSLPPLTLHRLAATITVVSRMRAELYLGYTPRYTWDQAQHRSNSYYTKYLV
nr:3 beta-hydroxysteroid dehydrogenase/Delta 5-->4-isomerase-like [Procambarus clarkii]